MNKLTIKDQNLIQSQETSTQLDRNICNVTALVKANHDWPIKKDFSLNSKHIGPPFIIVPQYTGVTRANITLRPVTQILPSNFLKIKSLKKKKKKKNSYEGNYIFEFMFLVAPVRADTMLVAAEVKQIILLLLVHCFLLYKKEEECVGARSP